jgi:hypothetical protein
MPRNKTTWTKENPPIVGKRWVKGESGNPAGRKPNSLSVAGLVRKMGEEIDEETGLSKLELLIRNLYQTAIAGRERSAEILLDRGWGKPVEHVITSETKLDEEQLEKIFSKEELQEYVERIRNAQKPAIDGSNPIQEIIL